MCFYAYWSVAYLALLLVSITLNFLFGYLLKTKNALILSLGIIFNLGIIFYYKYIIFAAEVFNFGENIFTGILLPLGISFYTFQQISYLVDVYRGHAVRQTFLEYVLYVSFFPQLIAGPIVYQADLVRQYSRTRFRLSVATLGLGVTVFAIGLFKKSRHRGRYFVLRRTGVRCRRSGETHQFPGGMGRCPDLYFIDLLRFLRLLGYGGGIGSDVRAAAPHQFQFAL